MITKESCPYCNGPLTLEEDNTEDDYYVYWCPLCERYVVLSYLPEGMEESSCS